jgi:undecaprenyl-diphosphatase
VIQLGAILSVVVYFRNRIQDFVRSFPKGAAGNKTWWSHPLTLVMISFAVTALPCYLIDDQIGENLENLKIIGWALILGGVAMWLIDIFFSPRATTFDMESMNMKQALIIGLAQILSAAFPGLSRSMSTIAGGQVMGLSRAAALEFSFFLSIPVMFAATGFKLIKFILENGASLSIHETSVLGVGFGVSFVIAYAVIAWFLMWVRQHGFTPFAIYRLIVGSATLLAVAWQAM